MRVKRVLGWTAALMLSGSLALAAALDVNSAPASDLATLDGVTEEMASAIVRERDENGPFQSAEDLKRVPGITQDIVARIKGRLAFGEGGGGGGGAKNSKQDAEVQKILKKFAKEPTVQDAQQAAVNYSRANPELIDSWRVRSRLRGLAPEARFGAGITPQRDYQWIQNNGTLDFVPPPSNTPGITRRDTFNNRADAQAQLLWRFDRLIFDPVEPQVNREAVRLAKHMDGVIEDVTRRYFERRRLQVELELNPPTDTGDRLRKEIRLQELTADLDGLTGGYFSAELKKRGAAR
jgi:competence protein ComEA